MRLSPLRPLVSLAAASLLLAACAARRGQTPAPAPASPSRVGLTFTPDSDRFGAATDEYRRLWTAEGAKMIATMERVTGLRFDSPPYADTAIGAIVFEGVSYSGFREQPMRLRASYPFDTKCATLMHELGHRLQVGVAGTEDEHLVLFLWLYDAWTALYGREFADAQVIVERARRGPYPAAWDAALALSPADRAAKFHRLVVASQAANTSP